jgi:hypothetical protein
VAAFGDGVTANGCQSDQKDVMSVTLAAAGHEGKPLLAACGSMVQPGFEHCPVLHKTLGLSSKECEPAK